MRKIADENKRKKSERNEGNGILQPTGE